MSSSHRRTGESQRGRRRGRAQHRCAPWAFAVTAALAGLLTARSLDAVEPAGAPPETTPDGFDPPRRLGGEEYAAKAEGSYFTGLPLINYDSNTGLGFAARGYYFFD